MKIFQATFLICALLLTPGCGGDDGPPMGTVSGKVTIGGNPPSEPILIRFINSSAGQGGGAKTNAEGEYELDSPLPVDEYTVYFQKIVEASGPVSTAQERLTTIPPEYSNEVSSPLKKSVEEGENTINLEIPKAE